MQNILELCTSPDKGGLELYFADITNQLSTIFNVKRVVGPKCSLEKHLNSDMTEFVIEKKSHYMPLKAAKKLAKIIDDNEINLVHLHWNKDLALAIFGKLFSKRKPKVVLTRQMQFPGKKTSAYHKFIYKNLDHVIAITERVKEDMTKGIPQKVRPEISTIYYGVKPLEKADPEVTQKLRAQYVDEDDDFLIGLFGRIDAYKGQHLLIEALRLARGKSYPFKAILVGHAMEDAYLEELKTLVKKNKLEDHIIFTGFVTNPRELMQACDTVVLTTVEETFGLVLIEAMSVGIPVIGSNAGGVPEIIEHKQSGLLFESGDANSLLDALETMYQTKKVRLRCIENAEVVVNDKFNYDKHVANVSKLFKHLLKAENE